MCVFFYLSHHTRHMVMQSLGTRTLVLYLRLQPWTLIRSSFPTRADKLCLPSPTADIHSSGSPLIVNMLVVELVKYFRSDRGPPRGKHLPSDAAQDVTLSRHLVRQPRQCVPGFGTWGQREDLGDGSGPSYESTGLSESKSTTSIQSPMCMCACVCACMCVVSASSLYIIVHYLKDT